MSFSKGIQLHSYTRMNLSNHNLISTNANANTYNIY